MLRRVADGRNTDVLPYLQHDSVTYNHLTEVQDPVLIVKVVLTFPLVSTFTNTAHDANRRERACLGACDISVYDQNPSSTYIRHLSTNNVDILHKPIQDR